VQINTCCIQGKPPRNYKCIKNATCVIPQPGKRIAHVLHCVDKLPQVCTISFMFFIIIFSLLWPTASKDRPTCGNPCHVPSLRERERAHQGAVVSHGTWTSKASQGMFMMGRMCSVAFGTMGLSYELKLWEEWNRNRIHKPLISHHHCFHKSPLQKTLIPRHYSTYHLVSFSV
jgi:hypothetical protein